MNEVYIVDFFVKMMSPLVPKGRLAFKIEGNPSRKNETDAKNDIISIAKKYKLHRNISHSQASIIVKYGFGANSFNGNRIVLYVDSVTESARIRRLCIIATLAIILVCLLTRR
jgi:hypothetical protein